MTQFRSKGKGSKRKVYPLSSGSKRKTKRTVATKLTQKNIRYGCPKSYSGEHSFNPADSKGFLRCVLCGKRVKMPNLIYRTNAKGERENIDYGWMSPTELQKELIYANQRGWTGEASLIRSELQKRSYERYKQETLQQQRKDRAEIERAIKLLKKDYAEELKDFRNGEYPNTTLNELRSDYIRELNMYLKQLKNPYPKLIPEDSDNYGP